MKRIDANHYSYRHLFDVEIDSRARKLTYVGIDSAGRLILHLSEEYNMGNAYGMSDEYFILDSGEYLSYLEKSWENGNISQTDYNRLLKVK